MSKPLNAFIPDILRWLAKRDSEPSTTAEAEVAGPWKVVPLVAGGFGLFQVGESPDADVPAATLTSNELALLTAAILPGTGRDPLYRLDPEDTPQGFAIESGNEVVGHLPLFNPDVTAALHVAGCLLRSPAALARLLEAGSGRPTRTAKPKADRLSCPGGRTSRPPVFSGLPVSPPA
jgi:hypothetical protein